MDFKDAPYLKEELEKSLLNTEALLLARKYGLLNESELKRLSIEHDLKNKIFSAYIDIVGEYFSLEEAKQCEVAMQTEDLDEVARLLFTAKSKIENFDELFSKALSEIEKSIV